jgi:hypothetical protein
VRPTIGSRVSTLTSSITIPSRASKKETTP